MILTRIGCSAQRFVLSVCMVILSLTLMSQTTLPYDRTATEHRMLPLNAEWQFTRSDSSGWMPASVPGCVHTDLVNAGIIADPFLGTNEAKCQWVGEKNWIYQTMPFEVDANVLSEDIVRMRFNGLDTYSTITLNDNVILKTDNAFRMYEVDVKSFLKKKNNVLRIYFQSPIAVAKERLATIAYPLPGDSIRAVSRKPQFHFGWDWGPKLITCGITKSIQIIAYSRARFNDIYLRQDKVTEELAKLTAIFEIHANTSEQCSLFFQISPDGDYWSTFVEMKKGLNKVELPFEIKYPKRWWCNDQGTPHLYQFDCFLTYKDKTLDFRSVRTGIRDIQLVNKIDSIGESFQFELNGTPVFAKGANYIPIKYFPATAKEEDYRMLLSKCKEAHFNMLRVWGGGVYENDLFYNLCDEMGIMVWQDFMFACSMYPADSIFITTVIEEAEQQTRRLRNHPSIALWCGNNENAEAWERWGWQQGLDDSQRAKIWRAYKDLYDLTLAPIVKRNTTTDWYESTPRYGRGDKRSLVEGDSHYWGVWHDAEPFEVLQEKIPRFMSEFGMQSFPSLAVLKEMQTTPSLNFKDPGFAQHQKHPRGFSLMDDYMKRWYKGVTTDSLEQYQFMSQVMQAEGMCMGIEAQRRNAPRCMGTLYWQLNDVWPSFSWSSIDYKGNDKIFFSMLRKVYEPQLISCVVEKDELRIYWISDNGIPDETLGLRYSINDANGFTLYQETVDAVNLKTGVSVIHSKKWKDILTKQSAENTFIRVELFKMSNDLNRYERSQKLTMQSSDWLVQTNTISRHYDDKMNRKRISLRDTSIMNAKTKKIVNK
jgi:beta-mannosidase